MARFITLGMIIDFNLSWPKLTDNTLQIQSKLKPKRFDNKLLEDCWMNSTLQMILTGLDHQEGLSENGSTLWSTLIYLKNQDKSKALSPLCVKNLLISRENERIRGDIGK